MNHASQRSDVPPLKKIVRRTTGWLLERSKKYWIPIMVWKTLPEWATVALYPKFFRAGDVYLEAGANNGISVFFVNKFYEPAFIHAIEPNPRNFKTMRRLIRGYPTIKIYNCAIGCVSEKAILRGADSHGSIAEEILTDLNVKVNERNIVTVRRLDDLKLDPPPTIMTLDVEGSEAAAIEGAKVTLKTVRVLMVETHRKKGGGDTVDETIKKILEIGGFDITIEKPRAEWNEELWIVAQRKPVSG